MPRYLNPEAMFWSKVDRTGGCWMWIPQPCRRYGQFFNQQAHRWIYAFINGPIPEGMVVRHSCDRPRCVNPAHLLLGTQLDNINDMDARGRRRVLTSEASPSRKLSREQVAEIRSRYATGGVTQQVLADEFGVSDRNISQIVSGRTWR